MVTRQSNEAHEAGIPPYFADVCGEVAPNGEAIGLRVQRRELGPVDLCLRIQDVQYVVSILLAPRCEATRRLARAETDGPPAGAVPMPLSAINVGQDDDDQTSLLLEIGTAALIFRMPDAALGEVGQTLLALSARKGGKLSWREVGIRRGAGPVGCRFAAMTNP